MSARSGKGDSRKRGRKTSVVGSKVSDVSKSLRGRGLPRGGIREKDGLTVAEGAMPDTTLIGRGGGRQRITGAFRIVAIVSGSLLAVFVIFSLVVALLSNTSMFSVRQVDAVDTEHLSAENIVKLAAVEDGTTLLNVDASKIEQRLKKNPWVGSVEIVRAYPDTLRLVVHERTPAYYVVMGTGGAGWLMGDDGAWIEPLQIEDHSGHDATDAALKQAKSMGLMLISEVPASVSPKPGAPSTDPCIDAVMAFKNQLSAGFKDQIISYSAPSEDDIACTLDNGIEISMGSPSNIDSKEMVAQGILDEYAGQVIYINVRVPSRPTYRRVNSKYVDSGTGATGTVGNSSTEGQTNGNSNGSSSGSSSTSTSTSTGNGTNTNSGTSGSKDEYDSATTNDSATTYENSQYGNAQSEQSSSLSSGGNDSSGGNETGYVSPYDTSSTGESTGGSKVEGSSNTGRNTNNSVKQ